MELFSNPHQPQPTSFKALCFTLLKHRQLIFQMIKREVVGRYKGSILGLAWSFFNPILMLIIYTFVFSVVFKSRWGLEGSSSKAEFALILFVGMIVFNFFSETISKAPCLILNNINYVKKVVFPIEILPVINFGAALFHALISFGVLGIAFLFINGFIYPEIIFLPLILLPLIFLILGLSWFLSSMGVFARDIGQTIGFFITLLMFLSPVFYPISAVPQEFRILILANPLTFIIEQSRDVVVFGVLPNWTGLLIYSLVSLAFMMLGFTWFQKTRKGFADVL
jgi:lipopolysaccharide transport system permease protein